MDKRWIGIFIIFIVGLGCMYLIVDSSTTVGKAITVVNEMTVTLPDGFDIASKTDKTVNLINDNNKTANVTIICMGDKTVKEFNSALNSIEQNDGLKLENKEKTENGHIVYYKNITSNKEYSKTFFVKDNRTIELKMDKYKNWEKDQKFIIDTVTHNFKQNDMDGSFKLNLGKVE